MRHPKLKIRVQFKPATSKVVKKRLSSDKAKKMDVSVTKVCRYFNVGFCKRGFSCKYFHPEEKFDKQICRIRACRRRHKKYCRYGISCKWGKKCEFKHVSGNQIDNSMVKIDALSKEITELRELMSDLKKIIDSKDEELNKYKGSLEKSDLEVKLGEKQITEKEDMLKKKKKCLKRK